MSAGAEGGHLPAEWEQLERHVEEAVAALDGWIRRARDAEAELERLRQALEAPRTGPGADAESPDAELMRLRAENAVLQERMRQARRRLNGLMQRLATLEADP